MPPSERARIAATSTGRSGLTGTVDELTGLAADGLTRMLLPDPARFPQTARRSADGTRLVAEGQNTRYAAIVALGLARVDPGVQNAVLAGNTVAALTGQAADDALHGDDPGAVALAAWAAAETGTPPPDALLDRLTAILDGPGPIPTVDYAWALTAAVATPDLPDRDRRCAAAADRLQSVQGPDGLFPHLIPPGAQNRLRAHIGCFADQVYPIQALARFAAATTDRKSLDAADRCAARIVALQGDAGQWWWHYDARTGEIVEGYPVYSVHQHAMGPMALLDLVEARTVLGDPGDAGLLAAAERGMAWLDSHPESAEPLIDPGLGVVWRKVGRREPRKAVRTVRAVTTSVRPGFRLGPLDQLFPPGPVDYECRPYELGWLLYAWYGDGLVRRLAQDPYRMGDDRA
jgi:hypothetical protein